jgi:hypothetical protein
MTKVVASNSGSVIGVACRYSRFGLHASSATAVVAPAREPVTARTIRAPAQAVTPKQAIETAEAKAPVR